MTFSVHGALHGTRDVAGARVDRLALAAIALGGARVEHQPPRVLPHHLGLRHHEARTRPRHEHGRLDARLLGRERPALGLPLRDPAVEHRHVVVAVRAQQVPEPGRDRPRRVVVGDHAHARADAGRAHHAGDLRLVRPRVPAGQRPASAAGSGEVLVHVQEDRSRDVPGPPGVAPATGRVQVPTNVDDAEALELARQPVRRDERVHPRPSYFIFVTGWATFL